MVSNMKGNIEQLFRERFQGHESPVDPGMWQAIQQQLGATAPAAADGVNELFRERFAEHEVPMDASVWQGISKELGHVTPTAPGQGVLGWAAATAGVLVVAAGLWYMGSKHRTSPPPTALVVNAEKTRRPVAEQIMAVPDPVVKEAGTTDDNGLKSNEVRSATAIIGTPSTTVPSSAPVLPADANVDAAPFDPLPNPASTPTNTPAEAVQAEPALVETIIQQITERTVNEVRANSEVSPSQHADATADTPPVPTEQALVPEIFMPNTFTPNGDQINDTYEVSRDGFEQLQMRVMSMKNDRLVFSTNTGEPWTGDGCEDGMYVVVVEAVTTDGRPVSKAKVVWLNRERMN